jgi:hypothetical protein
MRDAPPIAEATKAVDRVDLENLGGTRGIAELQERERFDVAREIDQPVISDVVEGVFGALEKRDRVRHLAHSDLRPREKRVGERDTASIGHLLAHRRTAFQSLARLVKVSFKERRRTDVGERERGHSRRTDLLGKR